MEIAHFTSDQGKKKNRLVCSNRKFRGETTNLHRIFSHAGLHIGDCFERYHTMQEKISCSILTVFSYVYSVFCSIYLHYYSLVFLFCRFFLTKIYYYLFWSEELFLYNCFVNFKNKN